MPGQSGEQKADVLRGSSHGSADAEKSAGMSNRGEMSGRRHAARGGFQTGDAAEVGGHANGSSSVASDTPGRTERGDRGRLPAARPARGTRRVPRVIRAAGDVVVGFVHVEEFGRVSFSEDDGAGAAKTGRGRGITRRDVIQTETAPAVRRKAGHVEAVLHRNRDSMQEAQRFAVHYRPLGFPGLSARLVGQNSNKSIQRPVVRFDLAKMGFQQFNGRDDAIAHHLRHEKEGRFAKHVWKKTAKLQLTCDNTRLPKPAPAPALSFRDARAILVRELKKGIVAPSVEKVTLECANGRVLGSAIRADRDHPALDRTARDGFAIRSTDVPGRLHVVGEVRAGARYAGSVDTGQAVEIMTGAPIPDGADTVVMIEHVLREGNFIYFEGEAPAGQFINRRGGEAGAGALLLNAGAKIGYAEVALLASTGCNFVDVYQKPRVAILATGDELVPPDKIPEPHQIRNSNAYALAAQVERAGGTPEILGIARDNEDETLALIDRGLASDLLLLSGGVSAGKYDLVESAFQSLGSRFFFDRVAIQPGQPVVFGCARDRFFFGLPGNPASTAVTFEIFARTAVEMLAGQPASEPVFLEARLTRDFRHRPGLTRFLPASVSAEGQLTPIAWTGSSDIAALTRANAFMVVDPNRSEWSAGEPMPVLMK